MFMREPFGMADRFVKSSWTIPILPNIIPKALGWETIDDLIARGATVMEVMFWQQEWRPKLTRYVNVGSAAGIASLVLLQRYESVINFNLLAMLQMQVCNSYNGFLALFQRTTDNMSEYFTRQFLKGLAKKGAANIEHIKEFIDDALSGIEDDLVNNGETPEEAHLGFIRNAVSSMKGFVPWFQATMDENKDAFGTQNVELYGQTFDLSFGGLFENFHETLDQIVLSGQGLLDGVTTQVVTKTKQIVTQSAQTGLLISAAAALALYFMRKSK
jgi:hypothetical protein